MKKINSFTFKNSFLSNFYRVNVEYHGLIYPTNEHAFQAQKHIDPTYQNLVQQAKTPGLAKRYGRQVKLRRDWEEVKINIMREIVMHKFIQNPELKKRLINTGSNTVLIEGNNHGDDFWGMCAGVGLNHLGFILMDTRRVLGNTRVYKRKRR